MSTTFRALVKEATEVEYDTRFPFDIEWFEDWRRRAMAELNRSDLPQPSRASHYS